MQPDDFGCTNRHRITKKSQIVVLIIDRLFLKINTSVTLAPLTVVKLGVLAVHKMNK